LNSSDSFHQALHEVLNVPYSLNMQLEAENNAQVQTDPERSTSLLGDINSSINPRIHVTAPSLASILQDFQLRQGLEDNTFFIGEVIDECEEKQTEDENDHNEIQYRHETPSDEIGLDSLHSEASGGTYCSSSDGEYDQDTTPRNKADIDDLESLISDQQTKFVHLRQVCSTSDDDFDKYHKREWSFREIKAKQLRRVQSAPSIFRERSFSFSSSCFVDNTKTFEKNKDKPCFIGFKNFTDAIKLLQKMIAWFSRKWPRRSKGKVAVFFQRNTL